MAAVVAFFPELVGAGLDPVLVDGGGLVDQVVDRQRNGPDDEGPEGPPRGARRDIGRGQQHIARDEGQEMPAEGPRQPRHGGRQPVGDGHDGSPGSGMSGKALAIIRMRQL